jgi:DNA transposition AAA+ family ATPase
MNGYKSELETLIDSAESITEKPCEKLELLKEIDEYYGRKENQRSMPLWLSVRIEKVINQ